MSISLSGLSTHHEDQLLDYTRFARSKRKEHCNEIKGGFDDSKDMQMLEDMYSQEDAHRILREIRTSVRESAKIELNLFGRMSSLFLQEIFKEAERKGVSMKIDFSKLDDAVKLAGIEKILGDDKEISGKKLQSLGGGGVDIKLVEQIKDMEAENRELNNKFQTTTEEIKRELKQNVELKKQLLDLREQVRDARRDYDNAKEGNESAMDKEREDLETDLRIERRNNSEAALREELETIRSELSGKIAESTQFKQLRQMIQAKNTQIKELRAKLR